MIRIILAAAFGLAATAAMAQIPIDPLPVDTAAPGDTVVAPPADTTISYGSGGVTIYPNGKVVYCPNPADRICSKEIEQPGGGIELIVYGSGGIRRLPDNTLILCPDEGKNICGRKVIQPLPPDTFVLGGVTRPVGPATVRIYDMNGRPLDPQLRTIDAETGMLGTRKEGPEIR